MKDKVKEKSPNQAHRKFKCRKCDSFIKIHSSDSWGDAIICSCGAIYELLTLHPMRLELIGYKKEEYYLSRGMD